MDFKSSLMVLIVNCATRFIFIIQVKLNVILNELIYSMGAKKDSIVDINQYLQEHLTSVKINKHKQVK